MIIRSLSLILLCFLFACSSSETTSEENDKPADPRQKTYLKYCMSCHGASGKMGFSGSADLTESQMPLDSIIWMINNGRNAMLPLGDVMSEQEIKDVADYVMTMKITE